MTVRYPKRFDAKLLKRYLKEGRGTGEGALYNPWVQISTRVMMKQTTPSS